ncbi:MAG: hypothetical protein M0Q38_11890 [Bacteroidales bacterium]|jgi:hypothetical protein|nr:hypothetical protein [Bacteroidales bacterium]
MYVFTSITNNYLPKARILGQSLKNYHPDWKFVVVVSETLHESIKINEEPFDQVLTIHDLNIPHLKSWIFKHTIMEICTAVKGPAAAFIAETTGTDKLMYIDPDIAVFDSLGDISKKLDEFPIILTPHQTKRETNLRDVLNNEVCFLKHGVYNLGFFAVKCEGQGLEFLTWYRDRLLEFCYIDFDWGLYTDQRWCDLAPALFDKLFIFRDPGYNVARWNLSQRQLDKNGSGKFVVDGQPLRFFHFSGYDSGQGINEIVRYVDKDHVLHELWSWYTKKLNENGQAELGDLPWNYSFFSSGNKVIPAMNKLYRERSDLQKAFPDPFLNDGTLNCYENWYAHEYPVNPDNNPTKTRFDAVIQSAKDLLYQIYLLFFGKKIH